MKLAMEEQTKYRLTGVVVILSFMAIFLPAMMKKSNHRFEESLSLTMRLPDKPAMPHVNMPAAQAMLNTVKVAHVDIDTAVQGKTTDMLVKAEPLREQEILDKNATMEQHEPQQVAVNTASQPLPSQIAAIPSKQRPQTSVNDQSNTSLKILAGTDKLNPTTVSKQANPTRQITGPAQTQPRYTIQLASFAQRNNAEMLVKKLRNNGYKATLTKLSQKNGVLYKVMVGEINQREDAISLQRQLAQAMQLNGFIVKTGVS